MTKRNRPLSLMVKLCSDRAAFEAIPQRNVSFNMDSVKRLFEASQNFKIVVYTPHIIIIESRKGREVTFSRDGRMLLKNILNEDDATVMADNVLEVVAKAIETE